MPDLIPAVNTFTRYRRCGSFAAQQLPGCLDLSSPQLDCPTYRFTVTRCLPRLRAPCTVWRLVPTATFVDAVGRLPAVYAGL